MALSTYYLFALSKLLVGSDTFVNLWLFIFTFPAVGFVIAI